VSIAALVSIAAGCGGTPGSSGSSTKTSTAAVKPMTAAQIKAAGNVNLSIVDSQQGGEATAIDTIIKNFMAKYPNVHIKRTYKDFDTYKKTLKLSMSSSDGPDIAVANPPTAEPVVQAGLVEPLDRYFKAYGWNATYPASVRTFLRIAPSGKSYGTGELYGVGLGGQISGLFYNPKLMAKLGIQKPATFADFEQALATAKAKGVQPLELGNLEKWPASQTLTYIMSALVPQQKISDWVAGKPGATFKDPSFIKAAATLKSWVDKGYINNDANGVSIDAAIAKFSKGGSLFLGQGFDEWPDIDKSMKSDYGTQPGFMTMPQLKAGEPPVALGYTTNPYMIRSGGKHKDVAAAFLNYLISPENESIRFNAGVLPLSSKHAPGPTDTVYGDVLKAWDATYSRDALVPFLDWATPTVGDTLFAAVQELIAGKASPQKVADTVQQDWTQDHGS
jgi:raffinose/stachyose/melibiose transport system substrate-binding protein